ncbi:hypothetical protein BO70DRAFT_377601 [Aspergillus heteromorphus CBS 117.55]|uniref:DUF202 domain-containing protein n=1 Tax=Aspergillus heteromorphus CBS 117.55 TaxID=1448321 RepID=A0A317WYB2_9EURO|nr:uncharacterized protein BO70DRAFT_377601 [Aspergillus heteromorphus CBS 117.55]PWY89190.1 hypothetical protein BO70DRAFT_377601 [Aspergillus heteromorphus CBS 117.55]
MNAPEAGRLVTQTKPRSRPDSSQRSTTTTPHPQPAARRPDPDLDALELRAIATHSDDEAGYSTDSISSGEYRVRPTRTVSRPAPSNQSRGRGEGKVGAVWARICRLWTRNVVLTVPQKSNRDHFALERTFLAYIRTSVMVAMQGVLIAQLFRLQHLTSPDAALGYSEVGVPLSVGCHSVAILIASLGAYRFWKQQTVVALGTVYAGGWELNLIGGLVGVIILTTFVLSVVIMVELDHHHE